jgi:hypothetical protein
MYISEKAPAIGATSTNVEIRFNAKIVLNGDYLVRIELNRDEIASLYFLMNADSSLEDFVDQFNRIRSLHDNGPVSAIPPLPFPQVMLKKIDDLELSVRSTNCCKNDNIVYVGDLVQKTEAELLRVPSFGRRSLLEIKEALKQMGLYIGMEVPSWPPQNIEELAKSFKHLSVWS